jgi:hypothetical protein
VGHRELPYELGYLFYFILISWGCSQVQLFFLVAMSQFDWPIAKKVETMKAPQNKRFYGKMECIPLWPTYVGDKTYEIKARCYWEHPWEYIGNLRNILRT